MSWIKPVKFVAKKLALTIAISATVVSLAQAEKLGFPEKEELKFGFIKLTDMAPIAVAYENGYFEDEGLYVKQLNLNYKYFKYNFVVKSQHY